MACCSGSCVVARNVTTIAAVDHHDVRTTRTMSFQRPCTSSIADEDQQPADDGHRDGLRVRADQHHDQREPQPGEHPRPPRARPGARRDARAGQRPAGGQRGEQPAGHVRHALRHEVPRHVRPRAVGVGHRGADARRPARGRRARPRPHRGPARAPRTGPGARTAAGCAGSPRCRPTSSTSIPATTTTTHTTTSATSVASARSRRIRRASAQTTIVAPATATDATSQLPTCTTASTILPTVLCVCGL